MDQMDVFPLLVLWGLFAASIYGLGLFLVLLAKVRRNRGGFRADSSAPEALLVTWDVDAGAGEIFAEGSEAGSGDMAGPDCSGLAGGDFGGDFGGFGGGGL